MTKQTNNKQNTDIEKLKISVAETQTDIKWMKTDIEDIKVKVTNDIPHKIDELKDKLNARPSWLISGMFALLASLIVYLLTRG